MLFRMLFVLALGLPAHASAQVVPALRPYSGLGANSVGAVFDRGGLPRCGPRIEASTAAGPAAPFHRLRPPFRYRPSEQDANEAFDLLCYGEREVVLIRFRVERENETSRQAWARQLKRYFDYLDRDRDGVLSPYELEFVLSNRSVQTLMSFGVSFATFYDSGRSLADFDRDADGNVSFDEFQAYYRDSAIKALRFHGMGPSKRASDVLSEEIFTLLDRDRNGRVSREEVARFQDLVSMLDRNEDECLTPEELLADFNQRGAARAAVAKGQTAPKVDDTALVVFAAGAIPDSFVEQLLRRYDKDHDLRISLAENCFGAATFQKIDKNHDGQLTIAELMGWKEMAPTFSVRLIFAPEASGCRVLVGEESKVEPKAARLIDTGTGRAIIELPDRQHVEIHVDPLSPIPAPAADPMALYRQADADNRGYFTEAHIAGPQFQYLRILFDAVDRDGDGKVTLREFNNYFDVQKGFVELPLTVHYDMEFPGLFSILDLNSDGRLSMFEIQHAWDTLRNLQSDAKDEITREVLKPRPTLRLSRGNEGAVPADAVAEKSKAPAAGGPLWFRKMDRNQDGYLSQAEFLGRTEDFEKVDLDHDGFISREEADAAEKRYRHQAGDKFADR